MRRSAFLGGCYAFAAAAAGVDAAPDAVALGVPDTPLAREAAAIARAAEPREIYNHSLRTFYFAELIARGAGTEHDAELVFIASILHDTGLCAQFMAANRRFQVDGANLARELLAKHGVTGARADTVWDAIALHDQSAIARWKQPEVRLVSAGVGADFGGGLDALRREDVIAVLAAAPRDRFVPVFLDSVAAFVRANPSATGNSWVTDVGRRLVPGFHLENFVDAVTGDDPFASYRVS